MRFERVLCVTLVSAFALAGPLFAAQVEVTLPLGRQVYQTNESIPIAVVRSSDEALPAGEMEVTVTGNDASQMVFELDVPAVAAGADGARRTEHVYLDGRLMRPGHYLVEVSVDGALATKEIDVYSHIRKTTFRLINWGRTRGDLQRTMGEDSLGYNLFYGHYAGNEHFIEAGVDYMQCCTMSGGHQMDLRIECDWSDPYVTRGGTVRVVRQALHDRTLPNVIGVHFYDEPGLTWHTHPETGESTPHMIPSQVRSFVSAFGRSPLDYFKVDPNNPEHRRQWMHWAKWKLSFMDAAWKEAQFGVSYVDPKLLSVTQSQYGFSAYADGYYFNVVRSLPVVSGHGGYDDYGALYFNPSYTLEMARARDIAKPCWYLPTWYGNIPSDRFRMEQYLSFQTNIQGMITPPDLDPGDGASSAMPGIVESNKLMARLGTVFTTMPVTRPPVAMLYSLSCALDAQMKDMAGANYIHGTRQGRLLPFVYLAGKQIQQQFMPVVEEDVLDGTLDACHRAVILTGIDYLDPKVIAALERFAARGKLVLMTGDCTVKIKGAVNLGVIPAMPDAARIAELAKDAQANRDELAKLTTIGKQLEGARPLADAIEAQLDKAGIKRVFLCDNRGIVATRQAAGDVEYLFAVNAAFDYERNVHNGITATQATITLDAGGRPAYDAVRGGLVPEFKPAGNALSGTFRFGAGQMRVFALTARPIGGVKVAAPVLRRDYTTEDAPIELQLGATVLDDQGGVLSGSIPLRVRVVDPLGKTRYELYRATKDGVLQTSVPLAANDPPGNWQVTVEELLANKQGEATFRFEAIGECGALAGTGRRAVSFGRDLDNIFRFARVNQDVTIVIGYSEYNGSAAQRIVKSLAPWGVRCTVKKAEEVNKPKEIPDEAKATWVGLGFGRWGQPNVSHTGFAVEGPVILLGNPQDNPLIDYLAKNGFLPFQPKDGVFPGRGRGMVAWQRDGVGHGQESITLIAHDAQGMAEAVGTMYEAVAGLEPLTRWQLPASNSLTAASRAPELKPAAPVAWKLVLPEGPAAMNQQGNSVITLTKDGSLFAIAGGKATLQKTLRPNEIDETARAMNARNQAPAVPDKYKRPDRHLKIAAANGDLLAVGYWGGTLCIAQGDAVKFEQQLDQDIAGMAWAGNVLVVGLADGRVIGLNAR